jgi:predicted enzyme related to lactoylglutathione lyase
MPRIRTATRRIGRTGTAQLPMPHPIALMPVLVPDLPPKGGVTMKQVASFTMSVALLCLLAFVSGRVDASAADAKLTAAGDTTRPVRVNAASFGSIGATEQATPVAAAKIDGAKESNMFLGLRTVKYDVPDIAKAKAWYSKVFGVEPYFDQPEYYVGYNIGGYELGLTPAPKAGAKRDAAGVAYWGVEDAHAAYKRLLELGATSVSDVQDVGGGILVAEVRDPFGNVIGIIYNPHFKLGETK